jgi:hypothetical protein
MLQGPVLATAVLRASFLPIALFVTPLLGIAESCPLAFVLDSFPQAINISDSMAVHAMIFFISLSSYK